MALSNRFENETQEAIQTRISDSARDDIDKRQGSVFFDLTSPMSIELAMAYMAMDQVLTFVFASEDMPGEYLDLRVRELGLERRDATKAEGSVTFAGQAGVVIPEGVTISTDEDEPTYFVTTAEATLDSNGEATVSAEAEEGGTAGNVAVGEIAIVGGNLSGVTSVTNTQAFDGGSDEETDEALLNRYYDRVRRPATSGNVYQYEQWAMSVNGVGDVKVYPLWNGNGTVKVTLLDTEKTAPSQTIIDDAIEYIEDNRPIGADITVVGATEVPINVTADITLTSEGTQADVEAEVTAAVTEYLAGLAFEDPIVRRAQIGNRIIEAEGVLDYTNLTVNGATANIEIPDGEVAVIGEVTMNAP